jgi:hypothetical protein
LLRTSKISSTESYFFFFWGIICYDHKPSSLVKGVTMWTLFSPVAFCSLELQHCILLGTTYLIQWSTASVLRRYVAEKYSSKSIDDKRLISTKSNLIYWSEYWLFDILLLRDIEIYLYSTIYEIKSFEIDLDSSTCRLYVVFRSWCECHEMNLFVNRSIKLSFEIFCSFFSSLAENLSMINESRNSINWKIIKIVKQTCLIESDDEMIKYDVFILRSKA